MKYNWTFTEVKPGTFGRMCGYKFKVEGVLGNDVRVNYGATVDDCWEYIKAVEGLY